MRLLSQRTHLDTQTLNGIRNILTLGYNPEQASWQHQNRLKPSEFRSGHSETSLSEMIKEVIENKIEHINPKHICVSSGCGIDSNTVLSITNDICKERGIKLSSLTLGYNQPNDEVEEASKIAKALGVEQYVKYINDPLENLPLLISLIKEPRWKLYEYDYIQLAKEKGCDLLLTGDGGDEMFLGYIFRYKQFLDSYGYIKQTFPAMTPRDRLRCYLSGHNRNWIPDQESMFGHMIKFSWESIYRLLDESFDNELEPLNQIMMADFNGKLLYDFVPTNNTFFQHFEIQGFVPLIAKRIRYYSTCLPARAKYDYPTNRGKLPLISILQQKFPRVWDIVARQGKLGFGIEIGTLWKRSGSRLFKEYISQVVHDGLISGQWLKNALVKAENGDPRYQSKLLNILGLEIWYRLFITKTIKPNLRLC